MGWKIKTFEQLTKEELYTILRERLEIFVVEQNCPYSEIDGHDQQALHMFKEIDGEIAAYSRIFASGDYYEEASIGRIIVKKEYRKLGLGKELLNQALQFLRDELKEEKVKIQAQNYLREFYASFGFEPISDVYILDYIPHLDMLISNLQQAPLEKVCD